MKCKRKHHTSNCEEKQENPTQSSPYQMKENRTSNSSQSPTKTIAKNTTHMGATHSLHPTNHILMQSTITKISGAGKLYHHERLVGLKRCLKKTIGKAYLNMVELNTILMEVEAVLNSRPLTYPYVDINDASPLTPSHFLCGHAF